MLACVLVWIVGLFWFGGFRLVVILWLYLFGLFCLYLVMGCLVYCVLFGCFLVFDALVGFGLVLCFGCWFVGCVFVVDFALGFGFV